MSETVIYEYGATGGPSIYSVSPGTENAGATVISDLSPGDQFVFEDKVYTYVGGADLGSNEVGFFAVGANGKTHFFSTSPISSTESLTLNTSQSYWVCFMAGTLIKTPHGPVRVEELSIGDPVLTAEGQVAPVKWLGRQTVSTTFANPNRVLPIRIRAGAIAENLPEHDLLLSPCHAILLDGVLVQAAALVNGSSIVRETDVPSSFVYYHIELEDHSLVLAEGIPSETFIDNVDRLAFDNWTEHEALYPQGRSIPELPHPRAASARQVPPGIVRKLDARAAVIVPQAKDAA
jgi:hypothetical protein